METKDHALLAISIAKEVDMDTKERTAFVTGNIMPDINLFTYISGHTYEGSFQFIEEKINSLKNKSIWNLHDYYKLGEVMHYLADYFTYPHTQNFTGSLIAHCRYERKLHSYIKKYLLQNGVEKRYDIRDDNELAFIIESHETYMKEECTVENDCKYITMICMDLSYDLYSCRPEVVLAN